MRRLYGILTPPERISVKEWANTKRRLSSKSSARPGQYRTSLTPYIEEILDVLHDPAVNLVVCMKSAQVGWTDGVINNFLGYRIDIDPAPIIMMFAKEGAAKEYEKEKFRPMVEVTDCLRDKVDMSRGRSGGSTALFKEFPGGFLKLVGSNSPSSVKSTPAPVVIIEEPDDANSDIRGQGNTIKLLMERNKTFNRRKTIYGGTPTLKGLSEIEAAYNRSDQRKLYVPCHGCGEAHVLDFNYLICPEDPEVDHPEYGHALPDKAHYVCPFCGLAWNDNERVANIRKGYWKAHSKSSVPGFYINELMSPFPGSVHAELARKRLEAEKKSDAGDETDLIAFVNSSGGLPYEYKSDAITEEALAEKALPYAEKTVPKGGLILTMGVDVQHDRLAIVIRAWGRGEESWLVFWGEIYAETTTTDKNDPVWKELDNYLFGTYRHDSGAHLHITAAGIDTGDGLSTDATYHYVRDRRAKGANIKATKGEPKNLDREIATPAKKVDLKSDTKAARFGLKVFWIGGHKAKTLISERLRLTGSGPGRMHVYQDVRQDYFKQVLAEVLAPSRTHRNKKTWQKKSGIPNEALDCEQMCLHQSRLLKLHLKKDEDWDRVEQELMQHDLLSAPAASPQNEPKAGTSVQVSSQSSGSGWGKLGQKARR